MYLLKSFIKNLVCLLLIVSATSKAKAQNCNKAFHIVILGSSTAYGYGASNLSNAWAYLYTDYLKGIDSGYIVDNLAVPGTTTYSAQPNSYIPPADRPLPLKGHNITKAIKLNADAVIVNFPSNDAVQNFSLQEQEDNFKRISDEAKKHNILVWVASPQPRNNLTAAQVKSQRRLDTWIKEYYKEKAIDFHSGLASAKDSILFRYDSGDGIHINDDGHRILYKRVKDEHITDSLCNLVNPFIFAASRNYKLFEK